jgi:hypothetical protein
VLVVDVENGSVASALVRLSADAAPKLFGEKRVLLPIPSTRDSGALFKNAERGLEEVLRHSAEVAARLRNHPKAGDIGQVEGATLFFSAPWGVPDLAAGTPHFVAPMVERTRALGEVFFGGIPFFSYTGVGALVGAKQTVLPYDTDALLVHISGEVSELVLLKSGAVAGYATLPHGLNNTLRTLQSHAGLSEHEARSALLAGGVYDEARRAAGTHFAENFRDAARQLLRSGGETRRVFVVARQHGDWFARALSEMPALEELFPQGGSIRAIVPKHVLPHFKAHATNPDLMLMLEVLFVDTSVGALHSGF